MQKSRVYEQGIFTVLVCGLLIVPTHLFSTKVNPQSGNNIWHLTAAIGTELDELTSGFNTCCIDTFTTLAAQSTLIQSDFDQTWTILGAIQSTDSVILSKVCVADSKIDQLMF